MNEVDQAITIFQGVFAKAKSGSSDERNAALMRIRNDPKTAIQAARGHQEIDLVLGEIGDPDDARELLESYSTDKDRRKYIRAYGDRFSVIIQIASVEDVIEAMIADSILLANDNDGGSEEMIINFLVWNENIKERSDIEEIYEKKITVGKTERTLGEWLLIALFIAHNKKTDDINTGEYDDIGWEELKAQMYLQDLIATGTMPRVSKTKLAKVKLEITRRKNEHEADGTADAAEALKERMKGKAASIEI